MFDVDACPCSGKSLAKLIRPAALLLLTQNDMHGYELLGRLSGLPLFGDAAPETAGVYRALRSMEEMGLVSSEWLPSASGPAKRRYHITTDGRECAGRWFETLQEYHRSLGALLAFADKALNNSRSCPNVGTPEPPPAEHGRSDGVCCPVGAEGRG